MKRIYYNKLYRQNDDFKSMAEFESFVNSVLDEVRRTYDHDSFLRSVKSYVDVHCEMASFFY